jgi:eukaryotic-like serine/threonine-protein kinase
MTPERHRQISDLYHEALELDAVERAAFLDQIFGADEELHREVQTLLAAHDRARGYFDDPAMEVAARLLAEEKDASLDTRATNRKRPLSGHRLKQYEFVTLIGSGGMGEVYRAHDHNLGRDVAIKILSPEFSTDRQRVARLRLEARVLATLNHPSIAAIYDVQEEDNLCGLVLELVDGETLAERIERGGLNSDEALIIAKQVADALAAAHEKGVIHRDLKPANMKITREGRVKVLDFGLAKIAKSSPAVLSSNAATLAAPREDASSAGIVISSPEVILGTPAYMSPEQAKGEPVDKRTDVWAFGCVLFEMLTGRRAFQGSNPTEVMAAIIRDDFDWASLAGLPSGIRPLLQNCLQKDPARRISDVSDIRTTLDRLSNKRPASWLSVPFVRAIGALAVLVALVLLYFAVSHWRSAPQPKTRSLAVLPTRDLSPVQTGALNVADGMTDEIIRELARLKNLNVRSFAAIMQYKENPKPPQEIGRELQVEFIVQASLRQGNRMRIDVELRRAADDEHLWSGEYERSYRDVLALEREMARDIARAINLELTPEEERHLARAEKVDRDALLAYMEGRQLIHTQDPLGFLDSIDLFEKAIEKDSTYANAYAGLAESYAYQGFHSFMLPLEAYPRASDNAQKALTLDPGNVDARVVLAKVHAEHNWDFKAAETEYKQIIELYPDHAFVYGEYAQLLAALNRFDEAIAMNERSIEYKLLYTVRAGWMHYLWRRYDASIQSWRKALELNPSNSVRAMALDELGTAYEMAGRSQEAFNHYQQAATVGGREASFLSAVEQAYAAKGLAGYWRRRLELETKEEEATKQVFTYNRAKLHARAGNKERTLEWLEKAFKEHHNRLIFLNVEAAFDELRSDPRYQDLMKRVGLLN